MRAVFVFIPALVLALLLGSCTNMRPGVRVSPRPGTADADSSQSGGAWQPRHAYIFVDGVQQGVTPATVTLRRSFEMTNLSLHVGPDFTQVRRYEIERQVSGNRVMLEYTFSANTSGSIIRLATQDLSKDNKGNYVIPYFSRPIEIEDHEYDLVIIVRE